ncbi:MAG: hypothetical protein LBM04_00490, partial [Opitutaceae bacterium]|nr:hypothetical protein [Opitutaceae bacterium]
AGGGVKAQNGISIDAAGRDVILDALLGGAAGALDTITITGASLISTVGIETTGTQFLAANAATTATGTTTAAGGNIEITGLLKSAASGTAIQLVTAGDITTGSATTGSGTGGAGGATPGENDPNNNNATAGMTTIRSGGGIEAANGSLGITGGITMEADTTLLAGGADGVDIDGRGRATVFHVALGGATAGGLSQLNIRNAGDILLSGVTTTGDQSYHLDDDAAMRLDGALIATGAGSITITNDRAAHAGWATIFSTATGGIHIETAAGDVYVSEFNTLLAFDNGLPDLTAGDILIKSLQGSVTVSNMIASHKIELTASPATGKGITLLGAHYQAGIINFNAIYNGQQTTIPATSFTVTNDPTRVVTGRGEARMAWLPQIRLYAYFGDAFSTETGRVTPGLFSPLDDAGLPPDSLFSGALYHGSAYPGWLASSIEAIQTPVNSNAYERSLELAALEENMKSALASFMSTTDAANRITGATRDELVSVGIFSRRPTAGEHSSRDYYRGLFQQIIRSEERTPEMYLVVDGRISEANARTAVELYHRAFMRRDAAGALVSRVPEIQAALQAGIRAFRAANRDAAPSAFAAFVRGRAGDGDADAGLVCEFIDGARLLFVHIDGIGLTRNEVAAAKSVLIRPLRAPGFPAGAIRDLIEPPAPLTPPDDTSNTAQNLPPPAPTPAITLSQNTTTR